jgi:hypothetical protein
VQGVGDKHVSRRIDGHAIGIAESTTQRYHRGIVAGGSQLIDSGDALVSNKDIALASTAMPVGIPK